MQYVFFEKGICGVQWGRLGESPRSWEIFDNFCVKNKIVRLLLTES